MAALTQPSRLFTREKLVSFRAMMFQHLVRNMVSYVLAAAVVLLIKENYILAYNGTESLPWKIWIIHKHEPVRKGDFVSFKATHPHMPGDLRFVKRVEGVAGDRVEVSPLREVTINGYPIGVAKTQSKHGLPLDPIQPGVIGNGQIFAGAGHIDSFDSRYALVGLISQERLLGRARPIF